MAFPSCPSLLWSWLCLCLGRHHLHLLAHPLAVVWCVVWCVWCVWLVCVVSVGCAHCILCCFSLKFLLACFAQQPNPKQPNPKQPKQQQRGFLLGIHSHHSCSPTLVLAFLPFRCVHTRPSPFFLAWTLCCLGALPVPLFLTYTPTDPDTQTPTHAHTQQKPNSTHTLSLLVWLGWFSWEENLLWVG